MNNHIEEARRGRYFSFLGSNREIRRLRNYLHEGERVDDMVSCLFGEFKRGRALLIATNERVLVIKDGWIFRSSQAMAYEDIKTIEVNTGLFYTTFEIHGEGMHYTIAKMWRWGAEHFLKIVRQRIGTRYKKWSEQEEQLSTPQKQPSQTRSSVPTVDDLYEQGIISLEQLQSAKQNSKTLGN